MLRKFLDFTAPRIVADDENQRLCASLTEGRVSASNVRALATGAALAVSLDTTPAVLVSIYEYAHRFRDRPRRTA